MLKSSLQSTGGTSLIHDQVSYGLEDILGIVSEMYAYLCWQLALNYIKGQTQRDNCSFQSGSRLQSSESVTRESIAGLER